MTFERKEFPREKETAQRIYDASHGCLEECWKQAQQMAKAEKPDAGLNAVDWLHAKLTERFDVSDEVIEGYLWDMVYEGLN